MHDLLWILNHPAAHFCGSVERGALFIIKGDAFFIPAQTGIQSNQASVYSSALEKSDSNAFPVYYKVETHFLE